MTSKRKERGYKKMLDRDKRKRNYDARQESEETAAAPTQATPCSQQATVNKGDSYQAGGDIIIQQPAA